MIVMGLNKIYIYIYIHIYIYGDCIYKAIVTSGYWLRHMVEMGI